MEMEMEMEMEMGWGLVWAMATEPEWALVSEREWALVSERELWGLALARGMESASAQGMVWEPVTGLGLWAWC